MSLSQRYEFTLRGKSPLLMHKDDVMKADDLARWRGDPKNRSVSVAGDDRSPGWTWQTYLYEDGENICMPGDNLMVALRSAGAKMPMAGKRGQTFKALTQTGLFIPDPNISFAVGKPSREIPMARVSALQDKPFSVQYTEVRKLGFELDVRRAKIGQSKHVRVRPRFVGWTATGTVEVVDQAITEDVLNQLFEIAGRMAGLCDWRPSSPQSPGYRGQFLSEIRRAS